jgi:hypothetical protein
MTILSKSIVFHSIPIKIPMTFIAGVEKSIIKSTKNTRPQVAKGIVKKKSNFGGIPILVSKVYYRVITIKAA